MKHTRRVLRLTFSGPRPPHHPGPKSQQHRYKYTYKSTNLSTMFERHRWTKLLPAHGTHHGCIVHVSKPRTPLLQLHGTQCARSAWCGGKFVRLPPLHWHWQATIQYPLPGLRARDLMSCTQPLYAWFDILKYQHSNGMVLCMRVAHPSGAPSPSFSPGKFGQAFGSPGPLKLYPKRTKRNTALAA